MTWRRGYRNILLLAGICLLLAGIITLWWDDAGTPPPAKSGKGMQVPTAPILRDQQPLNAFSVVAAKNLFSQDRTGPATGTATGKSKDGLEGRQLYGIIIVGDKRAALIGAQTPAGGKKREEIEVVHLGEEWNGLRVVEISSEAVTFQGKDGIKTLNFPE